MTISLRTLDELQTAPHMATLPALSASIAAFSAALEIAHPALFVLDPVRPRDAAALLLRMYRNPPYDGRPGSLLKPELLRGWRAAAGSDVNGSGDRDAGVMATHVARRGAGLRRKTPKESCAWLRPHVDMEHGPEPLPAPRCGGRSRRGAPSRSVLP